MMALKTSDPDWVKIPIDPGVGLPYWLNLRDGKTTWSEPQVLFGRNPSGERKIVYDNSKPYTMDEFRGNSRSGVFDRQPYNYGGLLNGDRASRYEVYYDSNNRQGGDVSPIEDYDPDGNMGDVSIGQLQGVWFPRYDATPPVLVGLSMDSMVLDVWKSRKLITFSLIVTDEWSGINCVRLTISGHGGSDRQRAPREIYWPTQDGHTELSGKRVVRGQYDIVHSVEPLAANGTHTITQVILKDNNDNEIIYNTSQLANMGFPSVFTVLSLRCLNTPYACPNFDTWQRSYHNEADNRENRYGHVYSYYHIEADRPAWYSLNRTDPPLKPTNKIPDDFNLSYYQDSEVTSAQLAAEMGLT